MRRPLNQPRFGKGYGAARKGEIDKRKGKVVPTGAIRLPSGALACMHAGRRPRPRVNRWPALTRAKVLSVTQ